MGNTHHEQLEAEANRILRDAGHPELARNPELIPTTDALAHSTRIGLQRDIAALIDRDDEWHG